MGCICGVKFAFGTDRYRYQYRYVHMRHEPCTFYMYLYMYSIDLYVARELAIHHVVDSTLHVAT